MDVHTLFVLLFFFLLLLIGWFLGLVLLTPKTLGTTAFLIWGKPDVSSVE